MDEEIPNTIVTWVWQGERAYDLSHAAQLAEMLRRTQTRPFRLVVIADAPGEIEGATVIETPESARKVAAVRTPESTNFPSSYRRLWLFSREAREVVGDRFLLVDVDLVPVGCWGHLFDHEPEAGFVGWRPGMKWGVPEKRVGGGTWRLDAGAHPEVWEEFVADPQGCKRRARSAGYRGSDQAWISCKLAEDCKLFPAAAGIHSIRDYTRDRRDRVVRQLPGDARMVHFNGHGKPWHARTWEQHPWLANFWPGGRP